MNWILGSIFGTVASIVLVTALTIIAELKAPLKDWLKETFAHHWVGKGVLALIVFVLVLLIVRRSVTEVSESAVAKAIRVLVIISALAALVLVGFFIFEAVSR